MTGTNPPLIPIETLKGYIDAGWHLVPLDGKAPVEKGWQKKENCVSTEDQLHRITGNVGLAHEFSGTCAIDIDDFSKAEAWLAERGVDLWDLINAPDAVRILSHRDNRAKLLYRLPRR